MFIESDIRSRNLKASGRRQKYAVLQVQPNSWQLDGINIMSPMRMEFFIEVYRAKNEVGLISMETNKSNNANQNKTQSTIII